MAKQPASETPAPASTPEDLNDLNARAAAAGEAVTTAEARGGKSGGGLVDVTTGDMPA